ALGSDRLAASHQLVVLAALGSKLFLFRRGHPHYAHGMTVPAQIAVKPTAELARIEFIGLAFGSAPFQWLRCAHMGFNAQGFEPSVQNVAQRTGLVDRV